MLDVCLPLLPYARVESPSLALGLLKSSLASAGLTSRVLYPNLRFAEEIGLHNYAALSFEHHTLIGEWTFRPLAFPDSQEDTEAFFRFLRSTPHSALLPCPELLEIRRRASCFILDLVDEILALRPKIVSCSSTFQQHLPSLALLRQIRLRDPGIVTVMGGANCEGSMGLANLRAFPWLDFVMSGEGDLVFAEACRLICDSTSAELPHLRWPLGVFGPGHRQADVPSSRSTVEDLDAIPIPDYDDYFEALKLLPWHGLVHPGLPVEASRGCWWGEKIHCRFCGLNGEGMGFRRKSGRRVLGELQSLETRYQAAGFGFVDNILAPEFFDELLQGGDGLFDGSRSFFFEVKANLSRSQLLALARAGVRWIQPGLESLHDEALKEMRKGTSTVINIQLLKWCRELGIRVSWSILTGFPGEQDLWLEQMRDLLPVLHHLQPPSGLMAIQYHRFSPYHANAEEFGLALEAASAYSHLYPVPASTLNQLAYSFEDRRERQQGLHGYYRSPAAMPLRAGVDRWRELFRRAFAPLLCQQELPDGRLLVVDTRHCRTAAKHHLEGLGKQVLLCCDPFVPRRQLSRVLRGRGVSATDHEIEAVVARLIADRLLVDSHGSLLSLPLQGQVPRLMPEEHYPGGALAQATPEAAAYRQPLTLAFRQPLT